MAIGDKLFVADKPTLDAVNTRVGNTTDAANAAGSLHAKIHELRDYVAAQIATVEKPSGFVSSGRYNFSSLSGNMIALNILGTGKLNYVSLYTNNTSYGYVFVIVDGITIKGRAQVINVESYPMANFVTNLTGNMAAAGTMANLCGGLSFKNSLVISGQGATTHLFTGSITWQYELE